MRKEAEIEFNIEDFDVAPDVETLAKYQRVGPLDFAKARQMGKFWPQEDSIDDFIATVRRWRDEEGDESSRELS